jgi:hypothetical protein
LRADRAVCGWHPRCPAIRGADQPASDNRTISSRSRTTGGNPEAHDAKDNGEQDVYEFVLDRAALFAGKHGLRPVGPDEPAELPFERGEMNDPFERKSSVAPDMPQMKTCFQCHSAPGVYSMLSMTRAFRDNPKANAELFRTRSWEVEMKIAVSAKTARFDWGLLKGKLEVK